MKLRELITEAKPKGKAKSEPVQSVPQQPLSILICPLFIESYRNRKGIKGVKEALIAFVMAKNANPTAKVGKDDKPFVDTIPANHAKLTSDVSIVYTLTGNNPRELKLFGVFTHDDIGTGQPRNMRKQQSFATKMGNQTDFKSVPPESFRDTE